MKKNRFIRISKRVMVLLLCCSLVSGACFNKYKVTANAAAMTATLGSYAAYEICLYIGGALLATCGLGAAYENRDQIAEAGKNFIDSLNLDEVSGWMLSKVNTTGQSYVYGTEALQEVQEMEFTVIQGGGNMPENNNDNDDDGDIDADDRTKELEQMGMWATIYLVEIIEDGVKPLIESIRNGEDNFISELLEENMTGFNGAQNITPAGKYLPLGTFVSPTYSDSGGAYFCENTFTLTGISLFNGPVAGYITINEFPSCGHVTFSLQTYYYDGSLKVANINRDTDTDYAAGNTWHGNGDVSHMTSGHMESLSEVSFNLIFPVFDSYEAMSNYFSTNDASACLNAVKTYQIADWLQEHWTSALTQINTGIRSLNDNMLIVGEAANQALINQSNGLGYIEDLGNRIATTAPLALPDLIADPEYYPADSSVPALAPEELPWNVPVVSPDSGQTPGTDSTPESGEDVVIGDYAIDLRKLFPFCIPFDFIALLRVLDAEPEAPRFEVPFVVPSVGIDEMYVIDLSMFNDVMEVIRLFELVGFVIGLMLLTGKVIKW